jgi:Bacterial Ig-like domain (group 3)/FG-GAP-like repeat
MKKAIPASSFYAPQADRRTSEQAFSRRRTASLGAKTLLAVLALIATMPLRALTTTPPPQRNLSTAAVGAKSTARPASTRNPNVQSPFQRIMAPHLAQMLRKTPATRTSGAVRSHSQSASTSASGINLNFPGFVGAPTLPLAGINFNPSPLAQNSEYDHNTLQAAVSGDFNNDGNLDLAVVQADGDVTMILNPGPGGSLATAKVLTPDTSAFIGLPEVIFLTTADLNGDGNLDLIGQDAYHTQLIVWMGNGDGTFQSAIPYQISPKSNASWLLGGGFAIVGDFNGDGFPDVATIEFYGSTMTELTLLNDGQGNLISGPETDMPFEGIYSAKFGAGDVISNGAAPTGIAFPLTSYGANPGVSVLVMKSNGDGSFAPAIEPTSALIADYFSFSQGSFYATNLTANFANAPSVAGKSGKGPSPRGTVGTSIPTTDFVFLTGDGAVYDVPYTDQGASYDPTVVNVLVGANTQSSPYSVGSPSRPSPLFAKGRGNDSTSPSASNLTPIPLEQFLNVADLNGDGALDLIVYSEGANYVYLNNGSGAFTSAPTQLVTGIPNYTEPQPGNFSGFTYTSNPSFIEADYALDSVSIYAGNGAGQFYAAPTVSGPSSNGGNYAALGGNIIVEATGDANGDGLQDVIAEDWTNSATTANGGYPDIVLGINNGGKPQANETSGYTFSTLLPAGHFQAINGSFVEPVTFSSPTGGLDVLIVSQSGLTIVNVSKGVAGPANWLYTPGFVSCPFGLADAGDVNGDGINDVVIAYPGDASCGASVHTASGYFTFLGNPDGSFQQPVFTAFGSSLYQARLIDFNGDGVPDLALSDQDFNNAIFGVYTVPNNADKSGTFNIGSAFDQAPNYIVSDIVPGDYNQDGKQDLTLAALGHADPAYAPSVNVAEASQGVLLLPGNGDFTFGVPALVNSGNYAFWGSYADFNGDGTPDLALAEYGSAIDPGDENILQSTPLAQILPNLGGGSFGAPITLYDAEYDFEDFDVPSNPLNNLTDRVYTFTGNFGNSGGNDLLISGSFATAEFINQGTSTMTVTASPASASVGQTVTLAAAVKSFANPIPATGTVSFYNGGVLLGAAQLDSTGTASFATTQLPAGSDAITATYAGDSNYNTATGSATVSISTLVADTLTVTASPASTNVGQTVSLTAAIGGGGSIAPTGTVTFTSNGAFLGTASVGTSGSATFSTTLLAAGSDVIAASYAGDANYSPSTGSATVTIAAAAADSLTVTASSSTPAQGQSVSLTATIGGLGSVAPTGLISFTSNGAFLGASPVNANGVASFATSQLAVGTDAITATYPGDVNYAASSGSATVTVGALAPVFNVSASAASLSLVQGATGQVTLSIAANATFNGPITFSCAGAPSESTCGVNPGSLTVAAGQTGTATVVVATTPPNSSYQAKQNRPSMPWAPGAEGVVIAGVGLFLWPRRRALSKLSLSMIAAISLAALLGLSGCGNGKSTTAPPTSTGTPSAPLYAGTPVGSYPLTVSLTSGTTTVTQTITLQVTAN